MQLGGTVQESLTIFYLYFGEEGVLNSEFIQTCIKSIYDNFDCKIVGFKVEDLLDKYGSAEYDNIVIRDGNKYFISDRLRYKVAQDLVKQGPCMYTDFDIMYTKDLANCIMTAIEQGACDPIVGYSYWFVVTKPNAILDRLVKFYDSYCNYDAKESWRQTLDARMLAQCFKGEGKLARCINRGLGEIMLSVGKPDDYLERAHIFGLHNVYYPCVLTRYLASSFVGVENDIKVFDNIKGAPFGVHALIVDNDKGFRILKRTRLVLQDFSLKRNEARVVNVRASTTLAVGSVPYFFMMLVDYLEKGQSMFGFDIKVVGPSVHMLSCNIDLAAPFASLKSTIEKANSVEPGSWSMLNGGNQLISKKLSSFRFHIDSLVNQRISDYFSFSSYTPTPQLAHHIENYLNKEN